MKDMLEIPLELPDVKLEKAALNEAGDFISAVSSTRMGYVVIAEVGRSPSLTAMIDRTLSYTTL